MQIIRRTVDRKLDALRRETPCMKAFGEKSSVIHSCDIKMGEGEGSQCENRLLLVQNMSTFYTGRVHDFL